MGCVAMEQKQTFVLLSQSALLVLEICFSLDVELDIPWPVVIFQARSSTREMSATFKYGIVRIFTVPYSTL